MTVVVRVTDGVYFIAELECGCAWVGMRHTDDVRTILDRAMDHEAH